MATMTLSPSSALVFVKPAHISAQTVAADQRAYRRMRCCGQKMDFVPATEIDQEGRHHYRAFCVCRTCEHTVEV